MKISAPTAIVLDSSPLSLLTQQPGHQRGDECRLWYANLLHAGCRFFIPEIADYETRRELVRSRRTDSVGRLDFFNNAPINNYLPMTTPAARLAADLWAQARQVGRPTATDAALDGDVLICAQALQIAPTNYGLVSMVIATANARHLVNYAPAELWTDILP